MNRVTLICCFNDISQFEKLKDSIENQTEKCKIIGIDNTNDVYKSCGQALNFALTNIETEYVIFSHQDIILDQSYALQNYTDYLTQIGDYDILGVAGKKEKSNHVITNIRHGSNYNMAGKIQFYGLEKCDTVDECFFGGKTKCFKSYPFDEILCNNWHLYAVERCLNAKVNGHSVYVCDVSLIHNSTGRINHAYSINFYQLSKKYAAKLNYIYTTCISAPTHFPLREIEFVKRQICISIGKY